MNFKFLIMIRLVVDVDVMHVDVDLELLFIGCRFVKENQKVSRLNRSMYPETVIYYPK